MSYQTTKPAIALYTAETVIEDKLKQICFGMEEEGVPFLRTVWKTENQYSMVGLSHQAALSSSLSVGLAVDSKEAVLHYRNLTEDKFVCRIRNYSEAANQSLRILGINAARLVKGIPFVKDKILEVSF